MKICLEKLGLIVAVVSVLSACGGGGGGGTDGAGNTVTPSPFVVGDLNLGKFSITGNTVMRGPFGNSVSAICWQKGAPTGVQSQIDSANFNCPGMNGQTGGGFRGILDFQAIHPVKNTLVTVAGESITADLVSNGSVWSNLAKGEAYGYSSTYSWSNATSNYPALIGRSTTFNISFKGAAPAVPTGLVAKIHNQVDISLTLYTKDQFGDDVGKSYPVFSKKYEGDFAEAATINLDPKAYDSVNTISSVFMSVTVSNKVLATRGS